MKKILYTLLTALFVLSVVSCGTTSEVKEETMDRPVIIGMANPFTYPETMEEAESTVGFSVTLPSEDILPEWVNLTTLKTSTVNM